MQRTRLFVAVAALAAIVLAAVIIARPSSSPASIRTSRNEKPVTLGPPPEVALAALEADLAGFFQWVHDEDVAAIGRLVEQMRADEEAAAAAAAARVPVAVAAPSARPALPSGGGSCANPVVPEWVAQRESGCTWDAYNATGCGGRGCLGFYQLDAGHFSATSPWNPSVPGACYGLDPSTPAGQTECASRLGPGAWG